ncbi:Uma2 family endonuclease [Thiohalocapsa halophila]|nr:Uma2 family endonuclease [Thiohalocapsa halophila]
MNDPAAAPPRLPTEDDLEAMVVGADGSVSPEVVRLPTEDDLPSDDGEPMETWRHRLQMDLLIDALLPWAEARGDCFVGGNMFLYFSDEHLQNKDFRGPDVFVALGVSPRERKSWVVWQEGKAPDLVVELVSKTSRHVDKVEKKQVYQDQLRVAEYFWFDPWAPEDFAGFTLVDGRYQPIEAAGPGRIPSPLLGLTLGWWDGTFRWVETRWLRWWDADGNLLPTHTELAQADADAARANAEAEKAKAGAARADVEATERRLAEEARRAEAAEAELARLRAKLGEGGGD